MEGRFFNRMFWGLCLIGAGVLFLLNQMGKISINIGDIFSTYWPVFLIYFGLKGLILQHRYNNGWGGSYIWSMFIVILGCLFLGRNLDFIEMSVGDFFQYLIPVLLIIFGISMVFRPHSETKTKYGEEPASAPTYVPEVMPVLKKKAAKWHHHSQDWSGDWSGGHNRSSFIGDIHLGHEYWELKPMNISHFIGDTVLDLTKAQIPIGETRVNISAFIGDVKVFIPVDMEVDISVVSNSFLGDIAVFDRHESGFLRSMTAESPNYGESDKKIRLVVSMFIGDVKVMRVG